MNALTCRVPGALLALALVLSLSAASSISAPAAARTTLQGRIPYPVGTCADVWAEGELVFVARRGSGLDILDASDPGAPSILWSGLPGLFVQDVDVSGDLLVVSNESGNGRAVYFLDISDPANPVQLADVGGGNFFLCHNVALSGVHAYCTNLIANTVEVVDMSDPRNPRVVRSLRSQTPFSSIHDLAVVGDRLYVSWLTGGFEIFELALDPANPSLALSFQVPGSLIHNTWPLGDGIHVATTEEVSGGRLQIWDISSPSAVVEVASWRASPIAVMHNLVIADHLAFVTNYTEGLRVVDLRDPTSPREAAYYDSFPGVNPFTFGAWGVAPNLAGGIVLADFNSGIHILKLDLADTTLSAQAARYRLGDTIALDLGLQNTAGTTLPFAYYLQASVDGIRAPALPLLSAAGTLPTGFTAMVPFAVPTPAVTLPAGQSLTVRFDAFVGTERGAAPYAVTSTSVILD